MIELTEKGLYCPAGNFYIDPHRSVEHAVITHAHSDHARRGSKNYYCEKTSVGLVKCRLGQHIRVTGIPYRKEFYLGDAKVSFHSAGHILGSAQVRIEVDSEVWVVSGDYKREKDPTCKPFEVVECDVFITEATFGTPSFKWKRTEDLGQQIFEWWKKNRDEGINSVLYGYSLGKAQRFLGELRDFQTGSIYTDPRVTELTKCYLEEEVKLAPFTCLSSLPANSKVKGSLIIVPPSSLGEKFIDVVGAHQTAFGSGWIQYGNRGYDHGFMISDHADWDGLIQTIEQTKAREVYVLHREGSLIRHLKKMGIHAYSANDLKPGVREKKRKPVQLELF